VDCRRFGVPKPVAAQVRGRADLVYSFEVAEHVPAHLADSFVQYITCLGPLVVFTAAQPGQGGIGHINEQPLNYWIAKFENVGFCQSVAETETLRGDFQRRETSYWFYKNAIVFRRAPAVASHEEWALRELGDSLEDLAAPIAENGYVFHFLQPDGSLGPSVDIRLYARSGHSFDIVAKKSIST
jgi:hypothetical protein